MHACKGQVWWYFLKTQSPGSSLYTTIFKNLLFTALLIPSIAAYITPSTCLTFSVWHALKAHHPLHTIRSVVTSQNGPERCVHLLLLHSSSPIIPFWLGSPQRCTEWWVMRCIYDRSRLTSLRHLPVSPAAEEQQAAFLGLHAQKMHTIVLWLEDIAATEWRHAGSLAWSLSMCLSHTDTPDSHTFLCVSLYIL